MSSNKFTRSTEFKCQIRSQICNLSEPLDQSVYPLNLHERNKGASQHVNEVVWQCSGSDRLPKLSLVTKK